MAHIQVYPWDAWNVLVTVVGWHKEPIKDSLLPRVSDAGRLSAQCWWARLGQKRQSNPAMKSQAGLSWQVMWLNSPYPVVEVPEHSRMSECHHKPMLGLAYHSAGSWDCQPKSNLPCRLYQIRNYFTFGEWLGRAILRVLWGLPYGVVTDKTNNASSKELCAHTGDKKCLGGVAVSLGMVVLICDAKATLGVAMLWQIG